MTDQGTHIAGDGALGGIFEPNDHECYTPSVGEYTRSLLMDYPSIEQVSCSGSYLLFGSDHTVRVR